VPDVLLSGHHARIEQWRLERSRERGASAGLEPRSSASEERAER
jgi:tRNA G37 N-methylase TrmD